MRISRLSFVRVAVWVAFVVCRPVSAAATDVTAALSTDTTWTAAGSPYRVTLAYPARLVPDGVTLTVEPGVQILFDGTLEIDGRLVAVGTAGARITIGPITPGGYPILTFSRIVAGPVYANALEYVDITGHVNVSRQSLTMTHATVTASTASLTPLVSTYRGVSGTYADATVSITANTLTYATSYNEGGWTPRNLAAIYVDGHGGTIDGNTIGITTSGSFVTASGIYVTASNTGAFALSATSNVVSVTAQHVDTPSAHGIHVASSQVTATVDDNQITVTGPDSVYGIAATTFDHIADNVISVSSSSAEVYAYVYGIQAPSTSGTTSVTGNRLTLWTDSQNRTLYGLLVQAGTTAHNRVTATHTGPSGTIYGVFHQYYSGVILNNSVKLASTAAAVYGFYSSNSNGSTTIRNNILATSGGTPSAGIIASGLTGTVTTTFNVLHGWETTHDGLAAGEGDVSADPQFADAALHLASGSPAVDAGDWADAFANEPAPNGGRIDAGAFGNTAEATASVVIVAPTITTNGGAAFSTGTSPVTLVGRTSAASTAVLVGGSQAGVTHTPGTTSWSYAGPIATGANPFSVTAARDAATSAADTIVVTYVPAPTVSTVTPASGGVRGGITVTLTGTGFVAGATTVQFGAALATSVNVADASTLTAVVPAGAYGAVTVSVSTEGGTGSLAGGFTYVPYRSYFAEGATGGVLGFDAAFALLNPDASDTAQVTLRFQKGDGSAVMHALSLPPLSRRTVEPATLSGLESAEFSTAIEADIPVVADRTMIWGGGYGSHAETAIASAATRWYLAEGATHSGFELFYLVQNPGATDATLEVTYLRPAPAASILRSYTVGAGSRFNIWVDLEDAGLESTDVSAVIDSDVPVIVERAMYRGVPGQLFGAGHNSAAIATPSTTWFFAEGATGDFFDEFVLVANPGLVDAEVVATFLLPDGTTIPKPLTVAALSRANIWVDLEDPRLRDTAVSVMLTGTNGVPVIAERAMWWPGPSPATWAEAHNAPGTAATGTLWALAEGAQGGARHEQTYILIANTSSFAGQARVTLLFEDGGTPAVGTFTLLPNSRFNVDPAVEFPVEFPAGSHRRFATLVESLGGAPAQIVVERSMYSDAGALAWAAGTDALATRLR